MSGYGKPVPPVTKDSEAYWAATRDHRLLLQRCEQCQAYQFYPRVVCTRCLSTDLEWQESSGRGEVYTFSVVYRAPSKEFEADVPYAVAIVELPEGVRLLSRIVGCPVDGVRIGMKVRVVFEDMGGAGALPQFAPA